MLPANGSGGVGALCRLSLQALGSVCSAAGEQGGGGLRKLGGEQAGTARRCGGSAKGAQLWCGGGKVQNAASGWDRVKLFPQELPKNGSGLRQEWSSSVLLWGIPSGFPAGDSTFAPEETLSRKFMVPGCLLVGLFCTCRKKSKGV